MLNRILRRFALAALTLSSIDGLYALKPPITQAPMSSGASANSTADAKLTAIKPAFTLSAPIPSTVTLVPGQASMVSIKLSANSTFSGTVTLLCSGATRALDCLVSPALLTLSPGQNVSATVAIATQGASAQANAIRLSDWHNVRGPVVLSSFFFAIAFAARRKGRWPLSLLISAGLLAGALAGCSRRVTKLSATPTGESTLKITAASRALTQTRWLTIHITDQDGRTNR